MLFHFFLILLTFLTPSSVMAKAAQPISTCAQLQSMSRDLNASYELIKDIDCSESKSWNAGQGFIPVGTQENPFTGRFNGNKYAITNLHIKTSNLAGLFGKTLRASINEVIVDTPYIEAQGKMYAGGLIGWAEDSEISNAYVLNGSLTGANAGGIIGLSTNSQLLWSMSDVEIKGRGDKPVLGALVGRNEGAVVESYSKGKISGSRNSSDRLVGFNSGALHMSYTKGSLLNLTSH